MPVLVEQQLQNQKLSLLSERNLTEALTKFVEKEDTDAISEYVVVCTFIHVCVCVCVCSCAWICVYLALALSPLPLPLPLPPPLSLSLSPSLSSFVTYSLDKAQSYLKERPGINEADIDTQVLWDHTHCM